jgi:hypothetical protein
LTNQIETAEAIKLVTSKTSWLLTLSVNINLFYYALDVS